MLLCSLPVSARRHAVGRPMQPQRILFVGNSLTRGNDLPGVLCRLAERTGKPLACDAAILDGASLLDHLDDGGAERQIADGKYTIVALQQGPSSLESSRIELIDSAEHFAVFIRAAGGRPAMYAVWPERARLFAFDAVADSYRLAAEAVHGVLFPVGSAWQAVWRVDPQFALYGPDGFHPSVAATYLAALVFYRVLYGKLPGSFAVPAVADELAGAPMHLSDRDLLLLVSAANEVVAARPGCCEP